MCLCCVGVGVFHTTSKILKWLNIPHPTHPSGNKTKQKNTPEAEPEEIVEKSSTAMKSAWALEVLSQHYVRFTCCSFLFFYFFKV